MRVLFILFLTAVVSIANAQEDYKKSAGIRLGYTTGLTFKKFIGSNEAIELMLSGRNEGTQFTALYLFHQPLELSFNDRFYFHYGIGGHVGYERFSGISKVIVNPSEDEFFFQEKSYFAMGINGSLGLEYRWLEVPITIGYDVKPFINFIGMRYLRTRFWDAAVSFKYVF
ncbi:MAG: hypothetical protein AAGA66_02030 [Bacteroidota bacterium]